MNNLVSEVQLTYKSKVKNSDRKHVRNSQTSCEIFKSIENYNKNLDMFECFYAMYLNRANKVLSVMLISEGGTSGTVVDIKKVLAPAILQNASGIIVSHNHPSGSLLVSEQDRMITLKLRDSAKLMDINLLDHIIITSEKYYSFADEGIL